MVYVANNNYTLYCLYIFERIEYLLLSQKVMHLMIITYGWVSKQLNNAHIKLFEYIIDTPKIDSFITEGTLNVWHTNIRMVICFV